MTIIENILHRNGWYRIAELQHFGHCGCCGAAIRGVFTKEWPWGLCERCKRNAEYNNDTE